MNDAQGKLALWIDNDEPAYRAVLAGLGEITRGQTWDDLTLGDWTRCGEWLEEFAYSRYGHPERMPYGWAREMIQAAYDNVDFEALAQDYVDLIAEDAEPEDDDREAQAAWSEANESRG